MPFLLYCINVGNFKVYYTYMSLWSKIDSTLAVLGFQDLLESFLFFCGQIIVPLVIQSVPRNASVRGNSDTASRCSCRLPSSHSTIFMYLYPTRHYLIGSECESGIVLIRLRGCFYLNTNPCT